LSPKGPDKGRATWPAQYFAGMRQRLIDRGYKPTPLPEFLAAVNAQRTNFDAPYLQTPSGSSFDVPERLKAPSLLTSEKGLNLHSRADYNGVDNSIQLWGARTIERCRYAGIPLYVHCAYRDKITQNEAFRLGHSRLRYPDAPHCRGAALDIVHSRFHWNLDDMEWYYIGKIGKEVAHQMSLDIEWGGDWRSDWPKKKRGWDPAHWQLRKWRLCTPLFTTFGETELARGASGRPYIAKTPRSILRDLRGHNVPKEWQQRTDST